MQKFSISLSVVLITIVFIYSLNILSANNKCTWIRSFECTKSTETNSWDILNVNETVSTLNSSDINYITLEKTEYEKLKKTWDLFLNKCEPKVFEDLNNYTLDYSGCKLNVSILKWQTWVSQVEVNGKIFSRDEINNVFK